MIDLEFVGDYRNPQQLTARQRELGFDGPSNGEFSFDDFIDIINPLQHIPVVSTLYRQITGDEISPHARIFGGTLFGGPAGFISAAANTLFDEAAGRDVGETLVALFTGDDSAAEPQFAGADDGEAASLEVGPAAAPAFDGASAEPLTTAAGPAAAAPPPLNTSSTTGTPATNGSADGVLTGQDALNALFKDLSGAGPPAAVAGNSAKSVPSGLPLAGRQEAAELKSYPLPPRPPRVAAPAPAAKPQTDALATPPGPDAQAAGGKPGEAVAAHPLLFAQSAGEAGLADRMMQALDKYRTMARQGPEAAAKDKARWQSDPANAAAGNS
ncbi:MAG: hypothetical protein RH942_18265 [Kiloniellaceae bacterium]